MLPGFINGHYHSGSALNRGMPQYIFERANVHVHAMWSPVTEEDLYHAVLANLMADVRGGQTGFVDLNYGRSGLPNFGYEAILAAYRDLGVRAALGVVTRDRNTYVHADDEAFLAMLPPELADRVRESSMGYAWPVDEVFAGVPGPGRPLGSPRRPAPGAGSPPTGPRPARTICTCGTASWPTSSTPGS